MVYAVNTLGAILGVVLAVHLLMEWIGLKGTVKLTGGWVPIGYWVLRRPVAAVRQFIGW